MNVLILDQGGLMLDFALRLKVSGHYPKLVPHIEKMTGRPHQGGDGLIEKIKFDDWPKHAAWADLIICSDNARWIPQLDVFKRRGFPVFAPSVESARLELDRGVGQALFAKHGIDVIPYECFTDEGKAEKYVLTNPARYVSKPTGDADKALSYVSQSPADMIFMLRRWAELNKLKKEFLLQEFVPGIEMAVGGWLGPKGFASYVVENFEHKKLMNDDLGPNTGEMGTVLRYTNDSELARQVLLPLERDLIKLGHTGFIDVSVIVDKDGSPRPLEFTSRLAWPLFFIQQVLHPDPVEWMLALLDGRDEFQPSLDVAVGVVLAIPDFPYSTLTEREVCGIPVYGLDDDNPLRHYLHPAELMHGICPAMEGEEVVDKKLMVSAGDYLLICSGCGNTIQGAKDDAYKAVESVSVPNNLLYRTDIGDRLKKELPGLNDAGFAAGWEY